VRGFVLYNYHMTKSALFRWLMISMIAGMGIESFISVPIIFAWVMMIAAVMAFVWAWRRNQKNIFIGALLVAGVIAGMTRMNYAMRFTPSVSEFSGRHITVSGSVREDPKITQKNQQLLVSMDQIEKKYFSFPVVVSVITRSYPRYAKGDVIRAEGTFQAKPYDGVSSGILFSNREEKIGNEPASFVLQWMDNVKREFDAHIEAVLPEPHASFMKGLLLGEKTSMPPELLNEFKEAGVSHIIALSGYNITLVGTLLVDILLMVTVPFWLTVWIAGISIIFFVLLTGATPSLVRAAIMGILVLVAMREGRMYNMASALICAGMVMLLFNPYLLRFDIGFQLSFLATLGLIYLAVPVERSLTRILYAFNRMRGRKEITKEDNRIMRGIKKVMSETIAAQLAVLPLLMYVFGGVSLIAPISNLFVLALVPSAMALGFFIGVARFVSVSLSMALGWCAWLVLQYELIMIHAFSHMPLSFVSVPSIGSALVIIVYALIIAWRWRRRKSRADQDFVIE